MRLFQVTSGPTTTRFAYDGLAAIAEFDASYALMRRYVHGPGMDEPLVQYEGAGATDRRFLSSDERGSIIAVTDSAANLIAANSYDEYGIPGSGNYGRFQYTGQMWLPEVGVYHYKARAYSPTLGRFLQTDPIGYADGMNIYAYTGNDPVNFTDPLGLEVFCTPNIPNCGEVTIKLPPSKSGSGGHMQVPPNGSAASAAERHAEALMERQREEMERRLRVAKQQRCGAQAVAENGTSIALDLAGIIPGSSTAATLGQLGLGGLGLINSAVRGDVGGIGLGVADFHLTSAEPLASQYRGMSKWAKILPGIGSLVSAASLLNTTGDIHDSYKKCMGGE